MNREYTETPKGSLVDHERFDWNIRRVGLFWEWSVRETSESPNVVYSMWHGPALTYRGAERAINRKLDKLTRR